VAQIATAKQQNKDDIAIFQACNLIERTNIQQIKTAIDEDCLAKSAIRDIRTKQDLAAFLHACAFSPLPSTLLCPIKCGHFNS
jgi:hypothetical protein